MIGAPLFVGLLLAACGGDDPPAAPERPARERRARPQGERPAAPADAPNVLLVVWDTVRADRLSMYGYERPTTPRMAAWAAEHAVVHERAVSPGVWTLPSHASLFTALPVRAHGVDAPTPTLDDRFVTFAQVLDGIGYDTYAFCANPYLMGSSKLLRGFHTKERPWQPPWRDKVVAHLEAKLDPRDASTPLSPGWTSGGGQNRYLYKDAGPVAGEALLAWIDRREAEGRPWFAFLNLMEAHLPRLPSPGARAALVPPELEARTLSLPQTTEHFHDFMASERAYGPEDLAAISAVYDASLRDLDDVTADLLARLDARGDLDDTIVVVTSDHGEMLGEDGLLLHKYTVRHELSRVPLMVSWKGHLPAGRSQAPVSVADVLPKVIELGAIHVPDAVRKGLAARPGLGVPGVVTEYNAVDPTALEKLRKRYPAADLSRFTRTWVAIEHGAHKLHHPSDGVDRLYDVLGDPEERADLAPTAPERVGELTEALRVWTEAVPTFVPTAGAPGGGAGADAELQEGLEALGYLQ